MAKHPVMRTDSLRSIRIPDLMGGLNLRDSVSMINDNQLTDAVNVWWADGTLRTRLGVTEKSVTKLSGDPQKLIAQTVINHDCTKEANGEKANLCSVKSVYDFSETKEVDVYDDNNKPTGEKVIQTTVITKTVINFFWSYDNRDVALAPLEVEEVSSYFAVWHNNSLYVFVSNKKIYKYVESVNRWNEINEDTNDELGGEKIYVPLVAAYCKTNGSTSMSADEVLANAVQYEGYNLLSNYYRMQYEAFNYEVATKPSGTDSTALTHKMTYFLLENISNEKYEGKTITVIHKKNGIEYTHTVTLNNITGNAYFEEATAKGDDFKIKVMGNKVYFMKGTSIADINENDAYSTIEITAPYIPDNREQELNKVFGMKRTSWYGGSSGGIDGGTRLFLCGNDNEKALVMWSGRNNPLYFPENSYFYVGEESSAVTGFGKQSNLLVIFKNDETWYTQYYRNNEITADQLINQSVVDYTASSVYFPLTQINSTIGCIYPDTVALCRNRLVWLSRGGKVYTLISENQYNERTIFCVSEMVMSGIKSETAKPTAVDWNEHYVLSFGNKFYLMDYNSYGFQYITSYSKTEDSNAKIPWYYWEVPTIEKQSALIENTALKSVFVKNNVIYTCNTVENQNVDITADGKEEKINCNFTTKLFDFDAPSYKKNIQIVNLLVGNNGGDTIKVEFVTDTGAEWQSIELTEEETNLRSAGYITNKSIFPCIKNVRIFGVKVSSKGLLAVDGMQFNFRILGGIR